MSAHPRSNMGMTTCSQDVTDVEKTKPPAPETEYRIPSVRIGVRDAKASLSRLLRDVKDGREVVITEYGKPVARLVPAGSLSVSDWIAEMESRGDIERQKPSARVFRPIKVPEGLAQRYLQEDREEAGK